VSERARTNQTPYNICVHSWKLVRRGGFVVKNFQNFVPQFPNIEVKTRNGRGQAQIGNNNKSVAAENREQSRTIRNFETCSFRRLLAVTRHQFAFCVADPVRSVQTEWQFDSSERPQKICVNLRNLWINSVLVSPIRVIRSLPAVAGNPWFSVLSPN
jgi:hypothetical protein